MSSPAYELPRREARLAPLAELFSEQFALWMRSETRGPRSRAFEALWRSALLDPACHTLRGGGKCFRARLTAAAWELAGGERGTMPEGLPWVVEILHAGSLIVDDWQDESHTRRGAPALHRVVGAPLAVNTGNLLYCWALELLPQLGLAPEQELALYRQVSRAMLRCHHGQGLDLSAGIDRLPQHLVPMAVRTTTSLKAGALTKLAALLGAVPAGAEREQLEAIAEFGHELGCGLQMLDDLSGVVNPSRRHKAIEDLSHARPTWIWSWLARELDEVRYLELRSRPSECRESEAWDELVDEIAGLVGELGKARVHKRLSQALDSLRSTFPGSEAMELLEAEVQRLENSYV